MRLSAPGIHLPSSEEMSLDRRQLYHSNPLVWTLQTEIATSIATWGNMSTGKEHCRQYLPEIEKFCRFFCGPDEGPLVDSSGEEGGRRSGVNLSE
jgi:hypothetical protein